MCLPVFASVEEGTQSCKSHTSNCYRSLRRREKDIFEELEKDEDEVDKMIDDYVAQQVEEQRNPRADKPKPKPRDGDDRDDIRQDPALVGYQSSNLAPANQY